MNLDHQFFLFHFVHFISCVLIIQSEAQQLEVHSAEYKGNKYYIIQRQLYDNIKINKYIKTMTKIHNGHHNI